MSQDDLISKQKFNDMTFELLSRAAQGIAAVVGPSCEVVVHDFSDLEHSARTVAGKLSGRKPGAPVPDMEFVRDGLEQDAADQLNYQIRIDGRTFQSSTIWVRDPQGEIIGALCINIDYSKVMGALELLKDFSAPARENPEMVVSNTLARDPEDLLQNSISDFLKEEGIPALSEMKLKDRQKLIAVLEERGLFEIRGSANRLAELLSVSRASIYNYRAGLGKKED